MTILPEAMYIFNVIPLKIPRAFFTELEQITLSICMETQKTPNSQTILRRKRAGEITFPDFRL